MEAKRGSKMLLGLQKGGMEVETGHFRVGEGRKGWHLQSRRLLYPIPAPGLPAYMGLLGLVPAI